MGAHSLGALAGGAPEQIASLHVGDLHLIAAQVARQPGAPVDVDLAAVPITARQPAHDLRQVLGPDRVDPPALHPIGHEHREIRPDRIEVGPRDMSEGKAAVIRRDQLYKEDGKLATAFTPRDALVASAASMLEDIQGALYAQAKERLEANVRRDVTDLAQHFAGDEAKFAGWVEVQWARPSGADLDKIVAQLKALKLTMRNSPVDAVPADGACFFTGAPAVERILIGRTY